MASNGADRVEAVLGRRREMKFLAQRFHEVAGLIFSQMPTVRSPCTLLCPRTGRRPLRGGRSAPQQAEIHDRLDVGDAVLCWVMPIAQEQIIRSDLMAIWAAS